MSRVYFVIPAYNESETIGYVLEEWYPVMSECGPDSRLVIVDDGSRDDTAAIVRAFAAEHPQTVLLEKENGGHGAAVLYGYRYALAQGAEYIFQTDSDGQTDPKEFPAFWVLRDEYDMVIGHRGRRKDGISRVFVTKVLRLVILCCFHTWVLDANTPYRLMKAETLAEYIGLIPEDYMLTNVLISVIYRKRGCGVKYLPISFGARRGGTNSINMKKIRKIGLQAWHDFRIIRRSLQRDGEDRERR